MVFIDTRVSVKTMSIQDCLDNLHSFLVFLFRHVSQIILINLSETFNHW